MTEFFNEPFVVAVIFLGAGHYLGYSFQDISLFLTVLFTAATLRNVRNTN